MRTEEMEEQLEELQEENKDLERALKNAEEKVSYHERFWGRLTLGTLVFLVSTGFIAICLFVYIMFIFDRGEVGLSNIQVIKTFVFAMMPSSLLAWAVFKS